MILNNLNKPVLVVSMFLLILLHSFEVVAQNPGVNIVGTWLNGEKSGKVEIFKDGDSFRGKIVWLRYPKYPENGKNKVDRKNPDESKRTIPLLGLEVLKGFKYENGEYIDGTIYDPKFGKTYECKMWFGSSSDELRIRGYWGWLFRTETWTRSTLTDR